MGVHNQSILFFILFIVTGVNLRLLGKPNKLSCTLVDPVHFKKIKFWSNSLPAKHPVTFKFDNSEVHFSFCHTLPDQALDACKITEHKEEYFYVKISNGHCTALKFDKIKNFSYGKTYVNKKKRDQISVIFFVGEKEHSITFPDYQIKSLRLSRERDIVHVTMPVDYYVDEFSSEQHGIVVESGFFFDKEKMGWNLYIGIQAFKAVFVLFCLLKHKLGEKILDCIRPFDFLMNCHLFYIITSSILELVDHFNDIENTLIAFCVPILIASVINWKKPSLSWRVLIGIWMALVLFELMFNFLCAGVPALASCLMALVFFVILANIFPSFFLASGWQEYLISIFGGIRVAWAVLFEFVDTPTFVGSFRMAIQLEKSTTGMGKYNLMLALLLPIAFFVAIIRNQKISKKEMLPETDSDNGMDCDFIQVEAQTNAGDSRATVLSYNTMLKLKYFFKRSPKKIPTRATAM